MQFEILEAYGKWLWWIRGKRGIIAKSLKPHATKEDCMREVFAVREMGIHTLIVVLTAKDRNG